MKNKKQNIVIFDGQLDDHTPEFENYIIKLKQKFELVGYKVIHYKIRDINLKFCSGCLNCWIKTPAYCRTKDEGDILRKAWINADLLIIASPLIAGFASNLIKTAIDNFLPLALPYFHIIDKELRHFHRHSFPPMACVFEPTLSDNSKNLQTNYDWVERIAYHLNQQLVFATTPNENIEKIIEKTNDCFNEKKANTKPLEWKKPIKFPILVAKKPKNILIFNGSLRTKSNTKILIEHIKTGFEKASGNKVNIIKPNNNKNIKLATEAWQEADLVLFAMPMYVHAMPGHFKLFIEELDKLPKKEGRRIGFLVQFGFPGAHQGRWLEEYLSHLPARWGAEYLGTIVRGGVEGIQRKTEKANKKLFSNMQDLGFELGSNSILSQEISDKISKLEYLPMLIRFVINIVQKTGLMDKFWNNRLKENNAFEKRFEKAF